jgi:starvation-inducible DNA-binding protein|tara:strand:+ start:66212 stop:66772 length:561 start_codon:yes stop_codon:yes gene_type:complete
MIKILKLSIVIIYYRFKFAILLNYKLKQIKMKRTILGLDVEKNTETVKKLNILLSNFQVYYQSLRGLHWNIKGKSFFELHVKFEEYYTDSQEKIDLIAERILTLQGVPLHTFSDYTSRAVVPIGKDITQDVEAVKLISNTLSKLLELEREVLMLSDDGNDEGTNSMMSDFITEQEKTIWMLKSWLS